MLSDLFSQFDPAESFLYSYFSVSGFWAFNFLFWVLVSPSYLHNGSSGVGFFFLKVLSVLGDLFNQSGMWRYRGAFNMLAGVFLLILISNWAGLLPGTFSLTSHFLFSVGLAVPLWLASVILNYSKSPLDAVSHLVGSGIPVFLSPAIVMCEFVSYFMRPVALGLRLGANMLAGHVILSLASTCSMFNICHLSGLAAVFYVSTTVVLFLFEAAVCLIQAFVFMMLVQIYMMETPAD